MRKFLLTILTMTFFSSAARSKVDESPIASFDVERYMGLWFEIARYDNWFERSMEDVTAEYTLLPSDKIRVENRGFRGGNVRSAIAIAKPTYTKGQLRVAFFLNFYAPYNVLHVAPDYSYALVSSGHKYLWILSRTPQLSHSKVQILLDEATRRGFDTEKLIWNV